MQTVSALFDAKLSILVIYLHPKYHLIGFFCVVQTKTDQELTLIFLRLDQQCWRNPVKANN